ncbi:MAG: thiocillin family RiPP [Anaerolineales bacterium]|nr:thiocillin family RiPP [Anaerolineales bacterium]MCA9976478.1 thiocillin family RiPP [Anaerolineales bacterium]
MAELNDNNFEELQDMDLFADELDERYNAGTVSSTTCVSSASCGSSCASCACSFSCLCSASFEESSVAG